MLKNLVRDWSAEGAPERSQSYGRILAQLRRHLGLRLENADPAAPRPRVLVPGAGLARLCVEVAAMVSLTLTPNPNANHDHSHFCARLGFLRSSNIPSGQW